MTPKAVKTTILEIRSKYCNCIAEALMLLSIRSPRPRIYYRAMGIVMSDRVAMMYAELDDLETS